MDRDSGDETAEVQPKQAVEARMQCYNVQPGAVDDKGNVSNEIWEFTAVYSNDPANINSQWSKWTPSANLKMYVTNEAAFGKISTGKQYRVLLEEL